MIKLKKIFNEIWNQRGKVFRTKSFKIEDIVQLRAMEANREFQTLKVIETKDH